MVGTSRKQGARGLRFFFRICIYDLCTLQFLSLEKARLRACLHGGGGPQVGEVNRLGGVTRLSI